MTWARNAVFLAVASTRVTVSIGKAILIGKPGSPAPLPTSRTFPPERVRPGGNAALTANEPRKCQVCTCSRSATDVRLTRLFQSAISR